MPEPYAAQSPDDLVSIAEASKLSGYESLKKTLSGLQAAPPISGHMGIRLVELEPGRAVFRGTPAFAVANPMGTTHGGWYGTILDSAMACAVHSKVPAGRSSTTLEYKVNIMRPLPAGMEAECISVALHVGRTTGVASAELRGVEDGKLYATGSTTCQIFEIG